MLWRRLLSDSTEYEGRDVRGNGRSVLICSPCNRSDAASLLLRLLCLAGDHSQLVVSVSKSDLIKDSSVLLWFSWGPVDCAAKLDPPFAGGGGGDNKTHPCASKEKTLP